MNCGMKTIKYLLFAFNLVFCIFALVLVGLGATVDIKYRSLAVATGSALTSAPVLLMCIGFFIFIVAFFGCCGAYKESYCMVTTFAGLMILIFIFEISAAITAYVLRGKIDQLLQTSFTESMIKEYNNSTAELFDAIQKQFDCCGSVNSSSWNNSDTFQNQALQRAEDLKIKPDERAHPFLPDSCCNMETWKKSCGLRAENATNVINHQGCIPTVVQLFKSNLATVGGIAVAIIFIQVIGCVFACLLMKAIRSEYKAL